MWKDEVAPRVAMLMEYFYAGSGVGLWGSERMERYITLPIRTQRNWR